VTQYGLDFLLAGTLDVKDGTYHLALELIRGRDGMHLKSLHFEGATNGLGAVPDKLAAELSPQIRQLSRETGSQHVLGGTTSQQAYDLAFRASSKLIQRNQGDVQQAASLYKDAAAVDPQFAKAWSGLSESKLVLANFGTEGATAQDFEDARSAAERALQLDPENAQAHSILGLILLQKDWRLEAAETQMRSAIAANSGLASNYLHLAVLLTDEGRFGEAQQDIDRAHQVDPDWPVVYGTAMYVHVMARQYERAIEDAQALVRKKPEWGRAHDHLGWALWYAGRHAAAVQEWHDAALLDHDDRAVQMEVAGADILERLGVRSYAQYKIAGAAKGVGSQGYVAAEWYAFAGDLQETLGQLAEMVRTRNPESLKIPINPAYDFVRSEPAYRQLMQALPTSIRYPAVRSHQQPSASR
jgi:tetratricopeptide (TPR) repeat protein